MDQLIALIQTHGLWLVFVNVLVEQAGVPVPAYPTLIIAGAYLTGGEHGLVALLLVGALAAVIADTFWYLAGRRFGTRVLRTLCRISLSPDSCVRQTETIFERFGPALDGVREVRARLRVGRHGARGRPRLALLEIRAVRPRWARCCGSAWRSRPDISSATRSATCWKRCSRSASGGWCWSSRRSPHGSRRSGGTASCSGGSCGWTASRSESCKSLLDANAVGVILDVRSPLSQAASGRIPGARPVDMTRIAEGLDGVPTDGEVIVYCACPNEATAVKVALKLRALGFKRVRPLHGGIDAWIEAGLDVER